MNTSHIDLVVYNTLGEILEDELPSLVDEFIQDASNKLNELKEHVKNDDAEKIFSVSHSLKSSSANLGAMQMSEICKMLEMESRNGSTKGAVELVTSLGEVFKGTSEELKLLIK